MMMMMLQVCLPYLASVPGRPVSTGPAQAHLSGPAADQAEQGAGS
jgi:hypothetical protein